MLIDTSVWRQIRNTNGYDAHEILDALYEACLMATIIKYTEEEGGFYGQVGDLMKECFNNWSTFIGDDDGCDEGCPAIRVLQRLIEKQQIFVYPTKERKHKRPFQDWDIEWDAATQRDKTVDKPAYTRDSHYPIFRFVYNAEFNPETCEYI